MKTRILTQIAPIQTYTIYAMVESGTERSDDPHIRYVGVTGGTLPRRLSEHIQNAKAGRMGNDALRKWILSCLKYKLRPVILPLQTCHTQTSATSAERHHIDRCRKLYSDLLNLRDNEHRTQPEGFSERYLKSVGAD